MVGLGTTAGADMCSCTIGMGADNDDSPHIEIDANFFAVGGTEAAVGDFCPGRLAISKFGCRISIVIVFTDSMVQFTAEDAADWAMLSAALRKRPMVVARSFSTMGWWAKRAVPMRRDILWRCQEQGLFLYE